MGEMITKFVRGTCTGLHCCSIYLTIRSGALTSLDVSSDIPLEPKQLFFTSSGRICVIIDVGGDLSLHLTCLQRNMASVIKGAGSATHTQ